MAVKGIQDVEWLSTEEKAAIRDLEDSAAQKNTSSLGKRINQGLTDALECQFAGAVLNDRTFRHETAPCLKWMAGSTVIGEEITDPERFQKLVQDKQIGKMGNNFVVYYDRMRELRGLEPKLIAQGLPFAEVEMMDAVSRVVCGSPDPAADTYLKKRFGWPSEDPGLGTFILGFNLTV